MQLSARVDTSALSQAGGLLLRELRRRPGEPADGRFSHLVGRHVGWTADGDGALHLPVEAVDEAARAREAELVEAAAVAAAQGDDEEEE